MKIYLVGFMGSGKTAVGTSLAKRLHLPFFDLDQLIEISEGMSIREIFAERGEPWFRQREQAILRTTQHVENGVIATGGGTFTFEDNIQFVLAHGVSIHLAAPFPQLALRIAKTAAERPMFRDEDSLRELYEYRIRYYKMADVTLDVHENESIEEIVERLVAELPKDFLSQLSRQSSTNS